MTENWESDGFEQTPMLEPEFDEIDEFEELPSFARRNRRRPAILMATVFAGGLAAIVIMRSLTGGIGQVMANTGIESTVNGFLDFMRDGKSTKPARKQAISPSPFDDLVTDHYASLQVPAESLRSNPFIIPWTVSNETHTVLNRSQISPRQRRAIRLQELEAATDLLELQLVMTGSNPIATINEQAVRVGDVIRVDDRDMTCILRSVSSHSVQVEILDDMLGLETVVTIPLRRHE
ncbi:MAG: hypothetical protein CMJ40_05135 [Phycisphaerae bacterium]|nr:hypothetical protein [Phycisphaerae bacterium]|tara:strand:- start:993 stop:1697 length:705 start_codon:yes stop_codon:yes gene_type:complete